MHDKVDVLIIGSGASGATVAWSLADTNMRIVCLEQGDWVRPNHDPSNRRDRESHRYGRFCHYPHSPRPARQLSDQRRWFSDQDCQRQWRRRLHRHVHGAFSSPASVGFQSTGLGRRRRRLAHRLRYAGAVLRRERPNDGGVGTCGRSSISAETAAYAAAAPRRIRLASCGGDEPSWLALGPSDATIASTDIAYGRPQSAPA
jgi:hypothetical protein